MVCNEVIKRKAAIMNAIVPCGPSCAKRDPKVLISLYNDIDIIKDYKFSEASHRLCSRIKGTKITLIFLPTYLTSF